MATIAIVKSTGRAYCRGRQRNCSCLNGKIPKDAPALRISINSSGKRAVAFYCFKCMVPILEEAKEAMNVS